MALTAEIAKDFPKASQPFMELHPGQELFDIKITDKHMAIIDAMRDRFDILYPLIAATYVSDLKCTLPENPEDGYDEKETKFRMWLQNILNAVGLIMAYHFVGNKDVLIDEYVEKMKKEGKDFPIENIPREFIFMTSVLKTLEINLNGILMRFQEFNRVAKRQ